MESIAVPASAQRSPSCRSGWVRNYSFGQWFRRQFDPSPESALLRAIGLRRCRGPSKRRQQHLPHLAISTASTLATWYPLSRKCLMKAARECGGDWPTPHREASYQLKVPPKPALSDDLAGARLLCAERYAQYRRLDHCRRWCPLQRLRDFLDASLLFRE